MSINFKPAARETASNVDVAYGVFRDKTAHALEDIRFAATGKPRTAHAERFVATMAEGLADKHFHRGAFQRRGREGTMFETSQITMAERAMNAWAQVLGMPHGWIAQLDERLAAQSAAKRPGSTPTATSAISAPAA